MILANGRLVLSIAAKYAGKSRSLSLAELCQEGVLGLIKAIDKFDLSKNVRLSTYATWWIRQAVTRALSDQDRMIRVPVHQVELHTKLRKLTGALVQELGRLPEPEELADRAGCTLAQVKLFRQDQEPLRLEKPVTEDGQPLAAYVPASEPPIEEVADKVLLRDWLYQIFHELLDARETRILEMRYGLSVGQALTLQVVADRFGLTRERIRQIEKEAQAKVRRSPYYAAKLSAFIER